MRPEGQEPIQKNREQERTLDVNILSLNFCQTVDEMIGLIEQNCLEGPIDTVILGEYDFKVEEVLAELNRLKSLAEQKGIDIILAPANQFGRDLTWGELKTEFEAHKIEVEPTNMPPENQPETVGMFIGKNGFTYAFPKTWHQPQEHKPVHKIPGTAIGVTICGEIHEIEPADLAGIKILYNPSREKDDPYLKYRMMLQYRNATRKDIAQSLEIEGRFDYLLESDDDHKKRTAEEDKHFFEELMKTTGDEKETKRIFEKQKAAEAQYDKSPEARKIEFEKEVDRHFKESGRLKNSPYVKKIEDILEQKNIPVVRSDGPNCTGILNRLPGVNLPELEYEHDYTRIHLTKISERTT